MKYLPFLHRLTCILLIGLVVQPVLFSQRHQPLFERYRQHFGNQDYAGASLVLDSLLAIDPRNNFWLFSKVETESRRGNTGAATDYLRRSIDNGYVYLDDILHNPHLAAIRATPDYRGIVRELEERYKELQLAGTNQQLTIDVPPLLECYVIMLYLGNPKHPLINDQQTHSYFGYINTYFADYKEHPLVLELARQYPGNPQDWINNLRAHHNLRIFYPYDSLDITKLKRYPIEIDQPLLELVRNFANATDFLRFYRENRDFYQAMKTIMTTNYAFGSHLVPFFNRHFSSRINRFNVYFSPIYGGWQHGPTVRATNYTECFYFGGIMYSGTRDFYYPDVNLLFTLLTEFDHTTINPITQSYLKQLEQYKDKVGLLNTSGSVSYGTLVSTLDEYITWAWALHFFYVSAPGEYAALEKRITRNMEQFRGFARFGEFMQLYKKYMQQPARYPKLKDFYPVILSWISQLQKKP